MRKQINIITLSILYFQLLFPILAFAPMSFGAWDICVRDYYGRGVGNTPPMYVSTLCPKGTEKAGSYCYPPCKANYHPGGVDNAYCTQVCPPGFRDDGEYCAKPMDYGRGVGFINENDCNNSDLAKESGGCEQSGLFWYPKCKKDYHTTTVNFCSYGKGCPDGMKNGDIGASCKKNMASYHRNPCGENREYYLGLCYENCRSGYYSIGPACLKECPSPGVKCGIYCSSTQKECDSLIASDVVGAVFLGIADIIIDVIQAAKTPKCEP